MDRSGAFARCLGLDWIRIFESIVGVYRPVIRLGFRRSFAAASREYSHRPDSSRKGGRCRSGFRFNGGHGFEPKC